MQAAGQTAVVASLVLVACAILPTRDVSQRMLMPETAKRYIVNDDQLFLMPLSLGNESPEFPAALAVDDLAPTTVCAEMVITDAGTVESATPLHGTDECGVGNPAVVVQLERSVVVGLERWRSEPAIICTYASAQAKADADGLCPESGADRRPVAVRLAYAFTFEMRRGQRRVLRLR